MLFKDVFSRLKHTAKILLPALYTWVEEAVERKMRKKEEGLPA